MPYDWGSEVMTGSGFTGMPAIATGPTGTGASEVVGSPAGQTIGQTVASQVSPIAGCQFCANPTVQAVAFIGAVILLAIGWHLHLYSVME